MSAQDFPVLKDVVEPAVRSMAPAIAAPVPTSVPEVKAEATIGLTQEQLSRIELEVREAVLKSLSQRMDTILEVRIREKLTDLLEQVLAGMTAELKNSMRDLMREVVARSVAQELSSAQAKLQKSELPK